MTALREAAQQALEYMKSIGQMDMYPEDWAIVGRLEAALAQQAEPVQEPIGYLWPTGRHPEFRFTQQQRDGVDGTPVYTAPPQQAEPVEPVAWMLTENEKYGNSVVLRKHKPKTYDSDWWTVTPLYTAPPQRKPLTEEEIEMEWSLTPQDEKREGVYFARRIERAHGIGGSDESA